MKTKILLFSILSIASVNVSAFTGALMGGGVGAAVVGTAANLITGVVQDKKLKDYKRKISCQLDGKKIANWDQPFNLPTLDIESARKEYYAKKNGIIAKR